jgi:hypothetical protein
VADPDAEPGGVAEQRPEAGLAVFGPVAVAEVDTGEVGQPLHALLGLLLVGRARGGRIEV